MVLSVADRDHQRPDNALWEMQIFIVAAEDDREASAMAERLGRQHSPEYRNQAGELISWRFVKVAKVFEIQAEEIVSGTEVFSRFLNKDTAERLLASFDPDRL